MGLTPAPTPTKTSAIIKCPVSGGYCKTSKTGVSTITIHGSPPLNVYQCDSCLRLFADSGL